MCENISLLLVTERHAVCTLRIMASA
jgi:hypothetical protein